MCYQDNDAKPIAVFNWNDSEGYGYVHPEVTFHYVRDGSPHNFCSDHALDDLKITAQGNGPRTRSIGETPRLYAMNAEYRDVRSVDARRAQGMVKTLTKIERSLAKANDTLGWISDGDYAEYMRRVCAALGVTEMWFHRTPGPQRSSLYSQQEWRVESMGRAVDRIRSIIARWESGEDSVAA